MKWFFQKEFVLETKLSPSQVQARIRENTRPDFSLGFPFVEETHLFRGSSFGHNFYISVIPSWLVSDRFPLQLSGEITEKKSGSLVTVKVTEMLLLLFMILGLLIIIVSTLIASENDPGDLWGNIGFLLEGVCLYIPIMLIARFAFVSVAKSDVRILARAIEADIT